MTYPASAACLRSGACGRARRTPWSMPRCGSRKLVTIADAVRPRRPGSAVRVSGASLAPPDDLVRVERDPDDGHERRARRAPARRGRPGQQRAGDRGDQAAAAERARNAHAERDVREQVERGAAAEAERRDRVELVADVCERRLHREREEDDAGHHRQMQVGVDIAREGDALRAGSVGQQLLRRGSGRSRSTPARTTSRRRTRAPRRRSRRRSSPVLRSPRPIAISDSPIAMITISPWRSTKCAGCTRQPLDAAETAARKSRRRARPARGSA